MTDKHPISPPPALMWKWIRKYQSMDPRPDIEAFIATQASQWGADQELEACIGHLAYRGFGSAVLNDLRAERRPKPPSLKEQARQIIKQGIDDWQPLREDWLILSRVVDELPDD